MGRRGRHAHGRLANRESRSCLLSSPSNSPPTPSRHRQTCTHLLRCCISFNHRRRQILHIRVELLHAALLLVVPLPRRQDHHVWKAARLAPAQLGPVGQHEVRRWLTCLSGITKDSPALCSTWHGALPSPAASPSGSRMVWSAHILRTCCAIGGSVVSHCSATCRSPPPCSLT